MIHDMRSAQNCIIRLAAARWSQSTWLCQGQRGTPIITPSPAKPRCFAYLLYFVGMNTPALTSRPPDISDISSRPDVAKPSSNDGLILDVQAPSFRTTQPVSEGMHVPSTMGTTLGQSSFQPAMENAMWATFEMGLRLLGSGLLVISALAGVVGCRQWHREQR